MKRVGPLAIVLAGGLVGVASIAAMQMRPDRHGCLEAAYWALNVFAVLGPLLALLAHSFWPSALTAVGMGSVLFLSLPVIGRVIARGQFGENAMILLVPVAIFPAALLAVGFVRLVVWLVRRRGELRTRTASV